MKSGEREIFVFKAKIKRQPKLVKKKLGQNKAAALFDGDDTIFVDPKYKGKKEMILIIHEYLHFLFPDMDEYDVINNSEHIADYLWKHHYRKTDNSE